MKIYCIIVTYNGSAWIEKCLSSFKESSLQPHVIIIDNASQDDTVKIIREKYSETELIESGKNLGFGQANNIGLKKALQEKADYVLLLNQDAWVEPDTIEKMIETAAKHPGYGILSPYHLNYEGTDTERYFEEWVVGHYTPGLREDRAKGEMKEVYESKFVHAACWLMPLSTIERVGGFDPLFFYTGEDNDYIQRLGITGLNIGIITDALVCHKGSNIGLISPKENLQFQINQSLLRLKNPKASTLGALFLFLKQLVETFLANDKVLTKAYIINLKKVSKILKSRRIQTARKAYLD